MPAAKKKKNKSIFSRINWQSPKSRGILILVIFAVIGGGVLVFRTFAATNTLMYSHANKNIVTKGAVTVVTDSNSKGGPNVYKLAKGGQVQTSEAVPVRGGKVCVLVRADRNVANGTGVVFGGYVIGGAAGGQSPIGVTTTWKEHCNGEVSNPYNGNGRGTANYVTNNSNVAVYVSYFTNVYDTPTPTTDGKNPTPTPAPTNPTPVVEPTCSKNCSKQ